MKIKKEFQDYGWFAFRVFVGLLFMAHGAQKLFGAFGGTPVELVSLFGAAGVIEFFGGLLVVIGLFSRAASGIASIEMLYAFFAIHVASKGIVPLTNGGEASLLFFLAFLVIFLMGPGKWALDNVFFKKKN